MKLTNYQNVLLTIIATCLIIITLSLTGIISKPVNVSIQDTKGEIPVEISSVKGSDGSRGSRNSNLVVVPVEVMNQP